MSGSGYLLVREMILSKLSPNSLFLSQDGQMFAGFRRSFDVPWIAQSEKNFPTTFGRQVGPLRLLFFIRLEYEKRGKIEKRRNKEKAKLVKPIISTYLSNGDRRSDLQNSFKGCLVFLPQNNRAKRSSTPTAARAERSYPFYQTTKPSGLLLR